MFVEIIRLFIVVLFTAAGFELAKEAATQPGGHAVLGATLGALAGYVSGGIVGRLVRRTMGAFEEQVERRPAAEVLAGAVGAGLLGLLSALLAAPAVFLLPGLWGWPVAGLLVWLGVYEGFHVAARKATELLGLAGLSARPLLTPARFEPGPDVLLLDTSAAIDGRLLAVAEAGFLRGIVVVPRFVLEELQGIADADEASRRRRGRRGLEVLDALRSTAGVDLQMVDDELPQFEAVDAKLVALARRLPAALITTDSGLIQVAELQGVRCLNLHRLADGVRPVLTPGQVVRLPISRAGREPGQGVGFLDDGTMVVVGDAATMVGHDVDVRITSNVRTAVGRMMFASLELTND